MRAAPAVLIFSDVAEKNESASAIDRLLGKDLAQSILVECIEFNPITERKITNALEICAVRQYQQRAPQQSFFHYITNEYRCRRRTQSSFFASQW